MATNNLTALISAVKRHATVDGPHNTVIPELHLYRASTPTELIAVMYEPSLCLVVQGCKEALLADEIYRYDPTHALLVSVELPVLARIVDASPSHPCLIIRITLDPAMVGELLAEGVNASPISSSFQGLVVSPLDPPVLDAVVRLVALLDSPQDSQVLGPLVLREITYRLLIGSQGSRLRQIALRGTPAQQIVMAIRWLKDHFPEPLRIELLAKHVRMSPSTFHLHFKNVTAMSPLQYQKRLRLQEARRLMMGEGLDAAKAALRVGYESPSQFSREYRRMFGAPPRQDVTALVPDALPTNESRNRRRSALAGS